CYGRSWDRDIGEMSDELEQHEFCYLTTTGRSTGRPHRIEIWFTIVDGSIWVNSGGRRDSDWVKNLMLVPAVEVEVGGDSWNAVATIRGDAVDHPARASLARRYQGWEPGTKLSDWAIDSLLIEIEATNE
ncbi:MAG: nitroreductase/quinone reductase family protein, partial [Acidimicrobiales bacterium]